MDTVLSVSLQLFLDMLSAVAHLYFFHQFMGVLAVGCLFGLVVNRLVH